MVSDWLDVIGLGVIFFSADIGYIGRGTGLGDATSELQKITDDAEMMFSVTLEIGWVDTDDKNISWRSNMSVIGWSQTRCDIDSCFRISR